MHLDGLAKQIFRLALCINFCTSQALRDDSAAVLQALQQTRIVVKVDADIFADLQRPAAKCGASCLT